MTSTNENTAPGSLADHPLARLPRDLGGPVDDEEDMGAEVWAGVLPLALTTGAPIPDAATRRPVPEHVARYRRPGVS